MSLVCKLPLQLGRVVVAYCGLAALALLAGCGGDEVDTYPLSGTITFQGESVPKGYIIFEPNTEAGNSGPGAQVDIQDGRYTTIEGTGTIGGPHLVRVYGFDGQAFQIGADAEGNAINSAMGRPLFPTYTFELDLPREPAERDLDVPAE